MYTSIDSMMRRYERLARQHRADLTDREALKAWQDEARARLSSLLGLTVLEKPADCGFKELWSEDAGDGVRRTLAQIAVEEGVEMPFYILTPQHRLDSRVFICPPGHQGGGMESVAGRRGNADVERMTAHYNYDYGLRLARMGHLVIAPDARGFGLRREEGESGDDKILLSSCRALAHMALPLGLTVAGLQVWDLMRLVDWLSEEGHGHIFLFGFSGGGLQSLYTAAVDSRVEGAFISGYYYGFKDSLLLLNGNCDCNYIPRLWLDYEVSDIASLIAPRPLVIQSARGDHLNGPRGLDNVLPYVEELREAYRLLGAEGKLYHDIIEGPHHFGHEHLKEDFEKIGMEI